MRTEHFIALVLGVLLLAWTYDRDADLAADMGTAEQDEDLRAFDIAQRTCALEVILRPRAVERFGAISPDLIDTPMPLDPRPEGTMLACVAAPLDADTSHAGIPALH